MHEIRYCKFFTFLFTDSPNILHGLQQSGKINMINTILNFQWYPN